MSDVGETYGPAPPGATITFDDAAPSAMPAAIPVSGTFKPTNYFGDFGVEPDSFPSPAPAAPYGTALSVFNGANAAGTWKLFVVDDAIVESGSIIGGWRLTISTTGGDYVATTGTLSFPPGVTNLTLAVPVRGDTLAEGNETFSVNLSSPINATIADGTGVGTILDDDGPSPPLGSGAADMLIDFGSSGLWARRNNTAWEFIHSFNPGQIAIGDIDGNGQEDIIADFPSCGCGIWAYLNRTTWVSIHPLSTAALATGDLDGNGKTDLVVNFGAQGVWTLLNQTTWIQITASNPTSILTADTDGDGRAEVIMNFLSGGLYKWKLDKGFTQIHTLSAAAVAAGNVDGVGGDELVISFPVYGTYILNGSAWTFLHPATPLRMTIADVDNSGRADIAIDFPGAGVWLYKDLTSWTQLHPMGVQLLTAGDFDNDGKADLLMSFSGAGTYERLNDTSWGLVHALIPDQAVTGRID
jgi:hypothetical protein